MAYGRSTVSNTGTILTDDQVEDAVLATLQKWLADKLTRIEEQLGIEPGYHERPNSWEVRNDFEKFPEEMLPMVIVISAGLIDEPVKSGGRVFRAPWGIGVATVATSIDQKTARRNAYRLGAAVRAALVHNQSLDLGIGGRVRGVKWMDATNDELPPEGDRTIFVTKQVFAVEVDDVLTQSGGPRVPMGDPPPVPGDDTDVPPDEATWPTIPDREHVIMTWIKEPIA